MPDEDHDHHDHKEEIVEEHSFDVLARSLADGTLSRQRALKLVGAAVLGGALSFFALPNEAEARRHKKKRHRPAGPTCFPTGTACSSFCTPGTTCAACCSGLCGTLGTCVNCSPNGAACAAFCPAGTCPFCCSGMCGGVVGGCQA
jgi:hypothetical protein